MQQAVYASNDTVSHLGKLILANTLLKPFREQRLSQASVETYRLAYGRRTSNCVAPTQANSAMLCVGTHLCELLDKPHSLLGCFLIESEIVAHVYC